MDHLEARGGAGGRLIYDRREANAVHERRVAIDQHIPLLLAIQLRDVCGELPVGVLVVAMRTEQLP